MKKISLAIASTVILLSCSEQESKKDAVTPVTGTFTTDGKKLVVYSTADSTNLRLSPTDTLAFKDKGKPFENEVTVSSSGCKRITLNRTKVGANAGCCA